MKTGFDLTNNDEEELKKEIVSYLTLFMENALRSSAIYAVKHGSRKTITKEDIKRSMMLELLLFAKRPGLNDKLLKIKKELFEEVDEEEEDMNDIIAEEEEEFEESKCQCGLCNCITTIYTKWNTWKPKNKLEEIMAKHMEYLS